eukprot:4911468-Prymnesium_polylepis.2
MEPALHLTGARSFTSTATRESAPHCRPPLQPLPCASRPPQVGDLIVSINGVLVRSHSEAIAIIDNAPEMVEFALFGDNVRLTIDRAAGSRLGISLADARVGVEVCGLEEDGSCA